MKKHDELLKALRGTYRYTRPGEDPKGKPKTVTMETLFEPQVSNCLEPVLDKAGRPVGVRLRKEHEDAGWELLGRLDEDGNVTHEVEIYDQGEEGDDHKLTEAEDEEKAREQDELSKPLIG